MHCNSSQVTSALGCSSLRLAALLAVLLIRKGQSSMKTIVCHALVPIPMLAQADAEASMTISFVTPVKRELKQHPREKSNWCCAPLGLTCRSTARSVSRHESKWCSLQVPALRKHLAATLKSEEEYLAGANAQEHHPAHEAARPITPPPQEQQLRQAPVSPYPVETVRSQLWCGFLPWRRHWVLV